MPRGTAGKLVHIRGATTDKDRTLTLAPRDFAALRKAATGTTEVKHFEKEYRRLYTFGLVKHRFDQSKDWPVALALLTSEGEQALAQEMAP